MTPMIDHGERELIEMQACRARLWEAVGKKQRKINESWKRQEKWIRLLVKILFVPTILAALYFLYYAPPEVQVMLTGWLCLQAGVCVGDHEFGNLLSFALTRGVVSAFHECLIFMSDTVSGFY